MILSSREWDFRQCFRIVAVMLVLLGASGGSAAAQRGGGFIFADSDRRQLSWREVAEASCPELEIARNEIFARRGRFFSRPDLTRYFSQFPWYEPFTWNPGLNRVEEENVAFIKGIESRRCR